MADCCFSGKNLKSDQIVEAFSNAAVNNLMLFGI